MWVTTKEYVLQKITTFTRKIEIVVHSFTLS